MLGELISRKTGYKPEHLPLIVCYLADARFSWQVGVSGLNP